MPAFFNLCIQGMIHAGQSFIKHDILCIISADIFASILTDMCVDNGHTEIYLPKLGLVMPLSVQDSQGQQTFEQDLELPIQAAL
jgi:hypothetical protein